MPRPVSGRISTYETNLARRIQQERMARQWSYEHLAREMEAAGTRIPATALLKIERIEQPRRITVDEFMAFSKVFDTRPEDLLLPASEIEDARLTAALERYERAVAAVVSPYAELEAAAAVLLTEFADRDELRAHVRGKWPAIKRPSEIDLQLGEIRMEVKSNRNQP